MRKTILLLAIIVSSVLSVKAQDNTGRVQLGVGLLYEKGMDLTLAYEHETRYHNAWEYFGNVYLKWDECASCGHICPEFFGTTITHGDWVSPTSRVSYGEETAMGISASVVRSVLIGIMFWAESMLAMNRTIPCVADGNCSGRSRVI